ncbi:hypothetical protein BDV18DRAFT_159411 [Aspergillus unguis]
MHDLPTFLSTIGQEVEDADEESFLIFSQTIPSSNLGFVDAKTSSVDITIHDHEYTIHQSPTLLSSSRKGGTTGAVLWKITPLFASWISDKSSNPLWADTESNALLTPSSPIVELGCGISALTALSLSTCLDSSLGGHYLATDQEYVQRLFRQNLASNPPRAHLSGTGSGRNSGSRGKGKGSSKSKGSASTSSTSGTGQEKDHSHHAHSNITFTSLDWETDIPDTLKQQIPSYSGNERGEGDEGEEGEDKGFDLLLSCDCIYNEALIGPFVRTCADIARLRPSTSSRSDLGEGRGRKPTICIIAQQQRSPDVFEAWLRETMRNFRVWRVNDDILGGKMGIGSGYLVHALLLK